MLKKTEVTEVTEATGIVETDHQKGLKFAQQREALLNKFKTLVILEKKSDTFFVVTFILHENEAIELNDFDSINGTTLVTEDKRVNDLKRILNSIQKKASKLNRNEGLKQIKLFNSGYAAIDAEELHSVLSKIQVNQFSYVKVDLRSSVGPSGNVTGFYMSVALE